MLPACLHHADIGLAEVGDGAAQEVGSRHEVGVEDGDELSARFGETGLEGPGLEAGAIAATQMLDVQSGLFELPGLLGDVKRIGIRSSTVRTFQGAEVIVPNGDLISSQVTNWTLSDQRRRIELNVGVRYGTDPTRVIELLLKVAEDDEHILGDPVPTALFLEFGPSSLDFQLRAWTAEFDFWMAIRSDLIVAVNRALAEAGIQIPFPQRDLHLRSVDVAARGAPAAPSPEPEGS